MGDEPLGRAPGKVYLLGAGPGDPELITARARRRLGEADLILYDALVHPDQLRWARPEAEKVFVGKRAGRRSERQAAIHARMIEEAQKGRIVARLKGGDPYLFGRGSEEAEALAEAGVPFEVVPGVPSPLAATAYAGISLSHRERSSSIAYLTATESLEKDRTAHDWSRLATATQTLVIFMGMRKLGSLMELLIEHGRDPKTPAAVIQWASLPRQRTVTGTVLDIAEKAKAAGLGLPALTVVGEVVGLRASLRWYDLSPLFGLRVLVTRPEGQEEGFSRALRDLGAEPIRAPAIRIAPPTDPAPLEAAVEALGRTALSRTSGAYRWVIFTSQNGVTRFFSALDRAGLDARALGGTRLAAIGPKTAESLREAGLKADVVPEEYRGEGAAAAVLEESRRAGLSIEGMRVLLPRAEVAREALPTILREAGAVVDVVPAYRSTGPDEAGAAALREAIRGGALDVATFTSPSTVERTLEVLDEEEREALGRLTLAAIGPVTADAMRALGLEPEVVATRYTAAGLVEALKECYRQRSR